MVQAHQTDKVRNLPHVRKQKESRKETGVNSATERVCCESMSSKPRRDDSPNLPEVLRSRPRHAGLGRLVAGVSGVRSFFAHATAGGQIVNDHTSRWAVPPECAKSTRKVVLNPRLLTSRVQIKISRVSGGSRHRFPVYNILGPAKTVSLSPKNNAVKDRPGEGFILRFKCS